MKRKQIALVFAAANALCCMSWCARVKCAAFIKPANSIMQTEENIPTKDVGQIEQILGETSERVGGNGKEAFEIKTLPRKQERTGAVYGAVW